MKYEYQILCPDTPSGYTALWENLKQKWEPVLAWHDFSSVGLSSIRNHIILRRPVKVTKKRKSKSRTK